jgi:hypothetical protein
MYFTGLDYLLTLFIIPISPYRRCHWLRVNDQEWTEENERGPMPSVMPRVQPWLLVALVFTSVVFCCKILNLCLVLCMCY